MAQPSTIVSKTRTEVTQILDALNKVKPIIDMYNDLGGQAFIAAYLDDEATGSDITTADFVTAISNLSQMQTWLDSNRRAALAKLRV